MLWCFGAIFIKNNAINDKSSNMFAIRMRNMDGCFPDLDIQRLVLNISGNMNQARDIQVLKHIIQSIAAI